MYRNLIFILISFCFLISCSSTSNNFTDSILDPTFDYQQIQSVGLIPIYWTDYGKKRNIDALQEKMMLSFAMNEFSTRKIPASIIPKENITLLNDTFQLKNVYNPDAIAIIYFGQNLDSVWIPGQSSGFFSLSAYLGEGGYSKVEAHQNSFIRMGITIVLLKGKPFYREKIWEGRIFRTSQEPELNNKGECLINNLFYNQFPLYKMKSNSKYFDCLYELN